MKGKRLKMKKILTYIITIITTLFIGIIGTLLVIKYTPQKQNNLEPTKTVSITETN